MKKEFMVFGILILVEAVIIPTFAQVPDVGPSGCVPAPGYPCELPSDQDFTLVTAAIIIGTALAAALSIPRAVHNRSKNVPKHDDYVDPYKNKGSSNPYDPYFKNSMRRGSYNYSAPNNPQYQAGSPPSPIGLNGGQHIGGVGINNPGQGTLRVSNVRLERMQNVSKISWTPPPKIEPNSGNKLIGYEAYRQIQTRHGSDWQWEQKIIDDKNLTSYFWNNVVADRYYGIKARYQTPTGIIISSLPVTPNMPRGI